MMIWLPWTGVKESWTRAFWLSPVLSLIMSDSKAKQGSSNTLREHFDWSNSRILGLRDKYDELSHWRTNRISAPPIAKVLLHSHRYCGDYPPSTSISGLPIHIFFFDFAHGLCDEQQAFGWHKVFIRFSFPRVSLSVAMKIRAIFEFHPRHWDCRTSFLITVQNKRTLTMVFLLLPRNQLNFL